MDSASNSRFDPNYAAQLLLDIAHEQSLDSLLQKVVTSAVGRAEMACAQVWLVDKGDICSACKLREQCMNQGHCLHLVAGKGVPLRGTEAEAPYFGDLKARIPLGVGLFGRVAATAQQIKLAGLEMIGNEMTGLEWVRQEQILVMGGTPIIFKGEVLGVISGFSRHELSEETRPWGRIFADHIGAAIANARAF
ncbi:MAG: GAF domain-containing protein [Limisphaerales bacterium]